MTWVFPFFNVSSVISELYFCTKFCVWRVQTFLDQPILPLPSVKYNEEIPVLTGNSKFWHTLDSRLILALLFRNSLLVYRYNHTYEFTRDSMEIPCLMQKWEGSAVEVHVIRMKRLMLCMLSLWKTGADICPIICVIVCALYFQNGFSNKYLKNQDLSPSCSLLSSSSSPPHSVSFAFPSSLSSPFP